MRWGVLFLSFFIVSFTLTLTAQEDRRMSGRNFDKFKIRALINEEIHIENAAMLSDTTPFTKQMKKRTNSQLFGYAYKTKDAAIRETYNHWRFGITGGMGMLIAPIPPKLTEDVARRKRDLRDGYFIGIDGGHFFTENLGLGIKYEMFKSRNTMDKFTGSLAYYEDFTGKVADKVTIHYLGPMFLLRSISWNKKIHAYCDVSLGYTLYDNNLKLNDKPYPTSGSNFGFASTVGVDFKISRNMAFGFNFSIIAASIKEIKVKDEKHSLNKDNRENLSRITFGMALRYYK